MNLYHYVFTENVPKTSKRLEVREHAIPGNVEKTLKQSESQRHSSSSSAASPMEEVKEATSVMTLDEREKPHISHIKRVVSTNQPTGGTLPDGIRKELIHIIDNQRRGKTNVGPSNVTSIWDYAGQLKYYITHRMFLTGRTSFGVVFSLLDDLDALAKSRNGELFEMTNLQMIVFWFRSIYEYAVLLNNVNDAPLINGEIQSPPISLIATHKDLLQGNEADKETQICNKFKKIFNEIEGTAYEKHVDRTMYAVDNTRHKDKGIEKLKTNVGGYMKAMARTVPTNWVEFQAQVQEVGKERLRLSLDEITNIAAKCGIAKHMLITVLDYLNDTGIILYSKTNETLKNTVIINLRMMIDFLTKIITVVTPDDIDKIPRMMILWHRLDYEGILEEELLRHLWRHEIMKDASNFDVFLELMKMFGLLFERQLGAKQGYRTFVVPSRMQVNKESLEVKKDEMQTISIFVTPTDFLPDAIYNMLVVAFLDLMRTKGRSCDHVNLFRNCSDFDLDDDHVVSLGEVKIANRHALKLQISRTIVCGRGKEEEVLEPNPSVCMELLSYLRLQLKTVYGTFEGVGYELCVLCDVCEPTLHPHLHKLDECLEKDKMICGRRKAMATEHIKRFFTTGFDEKSKKEIMNFLALQTLIIGRGTKEIRRYFLDKTGLTVHEVKPFLIRERQDGVLKDVDFEGQTAIVFASADNFEAFDMNILMKLIRYCCDSNHDNDFWENPTNDDNAELANLIRIYKYKKNVLDSSYNNRVTDEDFDKRWKELTAMFTGVGVPVEDIDNYRDPRKYKEGTVIGFNQTEVEEITNFQALFSVIVDLGSVRMREYILEVKGLKKKDIGKFLLEEEANDSFKKVRLFADQKTKMFTFNADIDKFDISILMCIIRNCCSNLPESFWTNPNVLPNLVLIHQYRNGVLAHTPNSRMSTKDFEIEWKKVESMLHAAGASKPDIDKYKMLRFATY
ncbi:uncharacterized protein LOC117115453 [Anneissia japonica]|uniref:uncharacterized protein LOC117115453 n=1 Tax=Anneissia japonica TaxID=1529436 RepID=UPI00142582AC|nr:uncharacterized protein LOC117115453 [Anneissia japonica]